MTDYIDFIDENGSEWTRTNRFREAKETIAAQAAVIEKLREALLVSHDLSTSTITRLLNTIPTDSTQVLAEVRRAEREKCAKRAEAYTYMSQNFNALAEEIRAME